jgi:outer membrane protein assembly factor BamE (lipoprotein component of BamABCDE complex)
MKIHPNSLLALALACGAAFLANCSNVEHRIQHNPEAFGRLHPDHQALVRAGQIALGFSRDAVLLALGDPDHVATRTTADGVRTRWHYLSYEAGGTVLFTGHYHFGRRGAWWAADLPYYLDYPERVIRDRFIVEFERDLVVAITREGTP